MPSFVSISLKENISRLGKKKEIKYQGGTGIGMPDRYPVGWFLLRFVNFFLDICTTDCRNGLIDSI
jgi:hypothetical protein